MRERQYAVNPRNGMVHLIRDPGLDPSNAIQGMAWRSRTGRAHTYCGRNAEDWRTFYEDSPEENAITEGPCDRCLRGAYRAED